MQLSLLASYLDSNRENSQITAVHSHILVGVKPWITPDQIKILVASVDNAKQILHFFARWLTQPCIFICLSIICNLNHCILCTSVCMSSLRYRRYDYLRKFNYTILLIFRAVADVSTFFCVLKNLNLVIEVDEWEVCDKLYFRNLLVNLLLHSPLLSTSGVNSWLCLHNFARRLTMFR